MPAEIEKDEGGGGACVKMALLGKWRCALVGLANSICISNSECSTFKQTRFCQANRAHMSDACNNADV